MVGNAPAGTAVTAALSGLSAATAGTAARPAAASRNPIIECFILLPPDARREISLPVEPRADPLLLPTVSKGGPRRAGHRPPPSRPRRRAARRAPPDPRSAPRRCDWRSS